MKKLVIAALLAMSAAPLAAQTLASHDRFDRIAANTGAKVVIQHEPADIAKLPIFPGSAR